MPCPPSLCSQGLLVPFPPLWDDGTCPLCVPCSQQYLGFLSQLLLDTLMLLDLPLQPLQVPLQLLDVLQEPGEGGGLTRAAGNCPSG